MHAINMKLFKKVFMCSWADLGFSREGGGIFKKFCRPFFRSTKLIFRALPKHCFVHILAKFSAPQAKFKKKKQARKAFLGTFWKMLTKKNRVFSVRSPPPPKKNSIYCRQRRL